MTQKHGGVRVRREIWPLAETHTGVSVWGREGDEMRINYKNSQVCISCGSGHPIDPPRAIRLGTLRASRAWRLSPLNVGVMALYKHGLF